ncbi:hypothetical protein [Spirosoma jeollabukense]
MKTVTEHINEAIIKIQEFNEGFLKDSMKDLYTAFAKLSFDKSSTDDLFRTAENVFTSNVYITQNSLSALLKKPILIEDRQGSIEFVEAYQKLERLINFKELIADYKIREVIVEDQQTLRELIDDQQILKDLIEDHQIFEELIQILDRYFSNVDKNLGFLQSLAEGLLVRDPSLGVLKLATRTLFYLRIKRENNKHIDLEYDKQFSYLNELSEEKRLQEIDKLILFESNVEQYHKTLLPFFIKNEKASKASQPSLESSKKESIFSYRWINGNEDDELLLLYNKLINQHIYQTSISDFKAAFSGVKIGTFQPVKWKALPSELLYFVRSLSENGYINALTKPMNYQKIKVCFVQADGSPFDCDFKSLNQRLEVDLSYKKKEQIDALLSEFL